MLRLDAVISAMGGGSMAASPRGSPAVTPCSSVTVPANSNVTVASPSIHPPAGGGGVIGAASGQVTACSVVTSELHDAVLGQKISARVKLFDFGAREVETVTITYPIDFLPA